MNACDERQIVVPEAVVRAILSQEKIDEPPHSFYKYPARFSPVFAREVIRAFSEPGETVLDPFCGGGTTLVEAMSLARRAVGFDISSLATFIARAKTTPLSIHDKRHILARVKVLGSMQPSDTVSLFRTDQEESYYQRNLPEVAKAFFDRILAWTKLLSTKRQQRFVRLVLLSVGQWALDCKTQTPTWAELQAKFTTQLIAVLDGHYHFLTNVAVANKLPRCQLTKLRRIINRSSEQSAEDGRIPVHWLPAKLVVTSPPYPGVHMLYHRWQIHGRRETPIPFWLANVPAGAGEAFYCLGSREEPKLSTYFQRLEKAFSSVKGLLGKNSLIVQLVAFSEPEWQLPAYLESMGRAGLTEVKPRCDRKYLFQGRIWRQVPGRKWYACQKGQTTSSKEVFLLHKLIDTE